MAEIASPLRAEDVARHVELLPGETVEATYFARFFRSRLRWWVVLGLLLAGASVGASLYFQSESEVGNADQDLMSTIRDIERLLDRAEDRVRERQSDDRRFDDGGFDDGGFDERGFDERGFDERGFDERGFDERGFDERDAIWEARDLLYAASDLARGERIGPGAYRSNKQDEDEAKEKLRRIAKLPLPAETQREVRTLLKKIDEREATRVIAKKERIIKLLTYLACGALPGLTIYFLWWLIFRRRYLGHLVLTNRRLIYLERGGGFGRQRRYLYCFDIEQISGLSTYCRRGVWRLLGLLKLYEKKAFMLQVHTYFTSGLTIGGVTKIQGQHFEPAADSLAVVQELGTQIQAIQGRMLAQAMVSAGRSGTVLRKGDSAALQFVELGRDEPLSLEAEVRREKTRFSLARMLFLLALLSLPALATRFSPGELMAALEKGAQSASSDRTVDRDKDETARVQIMQLADAIHYYRLDTGRLPESFDDIPSYIVQDHGLYHDPWGNRFGYHKDDSEFSFYLWSFGADGVDNGENFGDDIWYQNESGIWERPEGFDVRPTQQPRRPDVPGELSDTSLLWAWIAVASVPALLFLIWWILRPLQLGYVVLTDRRFLFYQRGKGIGSTAHLLFDVQSEDVIGVATSWWKRWFTEYVSFTIYTKHRDGYTFGGGQQGGLFTPNTMGHDTLGLLKRLHRDLVDTRGEPRLPQQETR